MKRRSFFGALAAVVVAPTLIGKIKTGPVFPKITLVHKGCPCPPELRGKTAKEVIEMMMVPVTSDGKPI